MAVIAARSDLLALVAVLPFLACVTLPNGPDIAVMPGTGKTFEHFRQDDTICRHFGAQSIAGATPDEAASRSAVKSALTGAIVGAAAGVAIGGGKGAAIGAGSGLLLGSAVGSSASVYASGIMQQRYDVAYMQCMYTKGNRVPTSGSLVAAPPPAIYPPPPPGYPLPLPRSAPPSPSR
jgi:hypothetical protein